ncbi:MAG: TetR/AcrR family transcriptional regulator C-terminal domain-containing protein [Erysipelotrichaceae bacterium]|nr:TetR/AcrR family transcriptional regulator C-terminal domain-containing protein [Erysipelotrichaceae bacterium]
MNADKTKQAISLSFQKLLEEKPFQKITISDISQGCGISRMTFYYHFSDIYTLLDWIFTNDISSSFAKAAKEERWQDGIGVLLNSILQHRKMLVNVLHSTGRDQVVALFDRNLEHIIYNYVKQESRGRRISEEDLTFITHFYKYAFNGTILDWIDRGFPVSAGDLRKDLEILMNNNINDDINDFLDARMRK